MRTKGFRDEDLKAGGRSTKKSKREEERERMHVSYGIWEVKRGDWSCG